MDVEVFHQSVSRLKDQTYTENEVCEEFLSVLDKFVAGMYRGDFLEGLDLNDSPIFDEWQFFQRDGLRQEFGTILQHLSAEYSKLGLWDRAVPYARRWVALDRLHEPAYRALMDLYARSGQRMATLHQYEELARLLKEQTGQMPEEETHRLYVWLAREVAALMGGELHPPSPEDPAVVDEQAVDVVVDDPSGCPR